MTEHGRGGASGRAVDYAVNSDTGDLGDKLLSMMLEMPHRIQADRALRSIRRPARLICVRVTIG